MSGEKESSSEEEVLPSSEDEVEPFAEEDLLSDEAENLYSSAVETSSDDEDIFSRGDKAVYNDEVLILPSYAEGIILSSEHDESSNESEYEGVSSEEDHSSSASEYEIIPSGEDNYPLSFDNEIVLSCDGFQMSQGKNEEHEKKLMQVKLKLVHNDLTVKGEMMDIFNEGRLSSQCENEIEEIENRNIKSIVSSKCQGIKHKRKQNKECDKRKNGRRKSSEKANRCKHKGKWKPRLVIKKGIRDKTCICDQCGKSFSNSRGLQLHSVSHSEERPIECEHCGKYLKNISYLKRHVKFHEKAPLQCDYCDKTFLFGRKLKAHIETHENVNRQFKCDVCAKEFVFESTLKSHSYTHIRKYKCEYCDRVYHRKGSLKHHMESHDEMKKEYKCHICEKRFVFVINLNQHLKHHDKLHQCSVCEKKFSRNYELKNHMRVHTGEKPYKCTQCDKQYRRYTGLREHIQVEHMPVKLLQCHICDRLCKSKKRLNEHIKTHSKDRPFKCKLCEKCFRTNSGLSEHMRTHSNGRNFPCEQCDKCYRSEINLKNHVQIHHLGKKLFVCSYCGKSYAQRNSLNAHVSAPKVECSICHQTFCQVRLLNSHLRKQGDAKLFGCKECGKHFADDIALSQHSQIATESLICKICSVEFISNCKMTIHLNINSDCADNMNPLKCKSCGKKCDSEKSLRRHVSKSHSSSNNENFVENIVNNDETTSQQSGSKYQCQQCNIVCNNRSKLYTHNLGHAPEKYRLKCNYCDKSFPYKSSLTKHLRIHNDEKLYKCSICGKGFRGTPTLKTHMKSHLGSESEHCEIGNIKSKIGGTIISRYGKGINKDSVKGTSKISDEEEQPPSMAHDNFIADKKNGLVVNKSNNYSDDKTQSDVDDTFECGQCQETFFDELALNEHVKNHTLDACISKSDVDITGNKYRCTKCDIILNSSYELKKHKLIHNKYKCKFCDRVFSGPGYLIRHLKGHIDEYNAKDLSSSGCGIWKCHFCDENFCNYMSVKAHMMIHDLVGTFECSSCGKVFNAKSSLESHLKSCNKKTESYVCHICNKQYNDILGFNSHVKTHSHHRINIESPDGVVLSNKSTIEAAKTVLDEVLWSCSYCKKEFWNRTSLLFHEKKHQGDYRCLICDGCFTTKDELSAHLKTHSEDQIYKCDFCFKEFNRKFLLKNHLEEHSGEKPFKCTTCGQSFTSKLYLQTHVQIHTDKTYNCNLCDKQFSQKKFFTQHVRVCQSSLTGEALAKLIDNHYVCEICGRNFAHKASLNYHLKTHSDEKEFECHICDKKFHQKGNLKRHLESHRKKVLKVMNKEFLAAEGQLV